ncbi:hypothetical protein MOF11_13460 [Bacillus haynesii]|uniref:hypothetical protein n=1 Tax=Bacillus haynesii TaxID=1925021 RepID=UPI0022802837|nr:hypothetical protein [Bacillus haynesii]MCY9226032.1 hypothetical protein [Bacillus haynesii]
MRAYKITYLNKRKVETQIIKDDFYQDAREKLKKQFKHKIEVLEWERSYEHENKPH